MKRIHILIALMMLSTLFMATTCDGTLVDYTDATFVNKTKDTLFVADWNGNIRFVDKVSFEHERGTLKQLAPDEKYVTHVSVPDDPDNDDSMTVFLIFKSSTMKKYSEEELAEKNIYDKKLFFTYEELENKGFLVEYDGK